MKYLAILIVLFALPAAAQTERFFVRSADNVIVAQTNDDRLDPPAGQIAVSRATIEAAHTGKIFQGGTWDGTTYTPPAGILQPASAEHRRRELAGLLVENWLPYASAALKGADLIKIASQVNALMRAIAVDANLTTDAHYEILHAEAMLSGATFLRFAGDQWTNLTDGYYSVLNDHFPTGGDWSLHTISQSVHAGTATDADTPGTEQALAVITTDAADFNWSIELLKAAGK